MKRLQSSRAGRVISHWRSWVWSSRKRYNQTWSTWKLAHCFQQDGGHLGDGRREVGGQSAKRHCFFFWKNKKEQERKRWLLFVVMMRRKQNKKLKIQKVFGDYRWAQWLVGYQVWLYHLILFSDHMRTSFILQTFKVGWAHPGIKPISTSTSTSSSFPFHSFFFLLQKKKVMDVLKAIGACIAFPFIIIGLCLYTAGLVVSNFVSGVFSSIRNGICFMCVVSFLMVGELFFGDNGKRWWTKKIMCTRCHCIFFVCVCLSINNVLCHCPFFFFFFFFLESFTSFFCIFF